MATEESPPNAVVAAVVDYARSYAQNYKARSKHAAEMQEMVLEAMDSAAEARAKFEQCIEWLDKSAPGWRIALSDSERRVLDLQSGAMVPRP